MTSWTSAMGWSLRATLQGTARQRLQSQGQRCSVSCKIHWWGSAVLPPLLLWCPSLMPGVWSRIGAPMGSDRWRCAQLCQHKREGMGREREWWGQELLISSWLSAYVSQVNGAECLFVPSVSPESACHDHGFETPLVSIPLKVLGCSPHCLTSLCF